MTNLGSILNTSHITLPTKVHLVKAMVFPVVIYECKSWTIKKAEHGTADSFKIGKGVRRGTPLDESERGA